MIDSNQPQAIPNNEVPTSFPIYSDPAAKFKINKVRKLGAICTFIYAIDLIFALIWVIALIVVMSQNWRNQEIADEIINSPTWAIFSVFITLFSIVTITAFIMNCVMIFMVDNIKSCCLDPAIKSEWTSVFIYLIVALFITLIFNIIAQVKIKKLALLTTLKETAGPGVLVI